MIADHVENLSGVPHDKKRLKPLILLGFSL